MKHLICAWVLSAAAVAAISVPAIAQEGDAPKAGLSLGSVTLSKKVMADGQPLAAGTYQVRLAADEQLGRAIRHAPKELAPVHRRVANTGLARHPAVQREAVELRDRLLPDHREHDAIDPDVAVHERRRVCGFETEERLGDEARHLGDRERRRELQAIGERRRRKLAHEVGLSVRARADLEERNVEIEQLAAQLERDRADLEERRPIGPADTT